MNRYARQIALPEIGLIGQEKLSCAHILMVGAGGLGAAALPYLAAAGIGHITIIDHDTVNRHNLHRQTIFRDNQVDENKAICAAHYLGALNPDCDVRSITKKLTPESARDIFKNHTFTLLLDGSDNFQTKSLLNDLSCRHKIPLLGASVNQFAGQIGYFKGYEEDQPCYHCLFPEFPNDARNCNEAGILGSVAGLVGLTQAHLALGAIIGLDGLRAGQFMTLNLKTLCNKILSIPKNPDCPVCAKASEKAQKIKTTTEPTPAPKGKNTVIEILPIEDVIARGALIIDVRNADELEADPLQNLLITEKPLHIPLSQIPVRIDDLPRDRPLAFVCAGNVRSAQAANYLAARGFRNVLILDKFSL